jgi:hypothetical protein
MVSEPSALNLKLNRLESRRCRIQTLKLHLSPKVIPPTMSLEHLPSYLKEVAPLEQAQVIKLMDMVKIPPIVRMKNLMMQGPTAPLDGRHHQGTILEPLSITLVYLLTIRRVLATLGRYPNLMELAILSGRTRWRSI